MAFFMSYLIPLITILYRFNELTGGLEKSLIIVFLFTIFFPLGLYLHLYLKCSMFSSSSSQRILAAFIFVLKILHAIIIIRLLFYLRYPRHPATHIPPWPHPASSYPPHNTSAKELTPNFPPPPRRSEISTYGTTLIDTHHRTLHFRGVNLSGSSKTPFSDSSHTSYTSRPFPLSTAPQHFSRLRAWGYTTIRLLVPWEAISPTSPDVYDEEYLRYLRELIIIANEHHCLVIIDPHQDVWSRWSGGSGAPRWTLEYVGFDVDAVGATGGGVVMNDGGGGGGGGSGNNMEWTTNHVRLVTATMFTLFFAGDDFAPRLKLNYRGKLVGASEWLQSHYMAAMMTVAEVVKDLDNVIGFESMNEPGVGYIGVENLGQGYGLPIGWDVSLFEWMIVGSGFSLSVDQRRRFIFPWVRGSSSSEEEETRVINPEGRSVWTRSSCIWKEHGVWGIDQISGRAVLYQKDYFRRRPGEEKNVNFHEDYMIPFYRRYAAAIRSVIPDILLLNTPPLDMIHPETVFQQPPPQSPPPPSQQQPQQQPPPRDNRTIWSPHYYDGSLFSRTYRSWIAMDVVWGLPLLGPRSQQRAHERAIARVVSQSSMAGGCATTTSLVEDGRRRSQQYDVPTIVTETGMIFHSFDKYSYKTQSEHLERYALDALLSSYESQMTNVILWHYGVDHSPETGDYWNGEDLSLHAEERGEGDGVYANGRALPAIIRPYPTRVAGRVTKISFDAKRRYFCLEFSKDDDEKVTTNETILFVPLYQYSGTRGGRRPRFVVSDGTFEYRPMEQMLIYKHAEEGVMVHKVEIYPGREEEDGEGESEWRIEALEL